MLTDLLEKMGFTLPQHDWQKPVVGVSACLLGQKVRYDGDHKHSAILVHQLGPLLRFRDTCPEVAIGLPVPRPPIQVVQVDDALRVKGVENPQQDVTEALEDVAAGMTEPLSGFVLKARSPSCGHLSTPVHNAGGQQIGMASGAFARKLHELFPRIPLANDSDLEKPAFLQSFLLQVYCYHQWHHSDHQGQWLNDMQAQSEQLDEPLHSGLRHYLDKLGQAMH
ncbi:MAG: hypothetical protein ACJASW_001470 [Polaribacter sp.]|jgi:uncharacterized protein YbbK (DUF523 family)|uniref:DUF523 domain-containing protein n=1 Tax=Alcanivorax sp. TaxID=1872427 RepID=UPI0039E2ADE5